MTRGVLAGVRVLDFGRYIAGPFCAALLADLGADVIRVERLGGGEDRFVYPVTETGDGALFLQMNRNKRAMTLDPKAPGAEAVARRLIESADVVVANLPVEALRDLGLDYERLSRIRQDIILTAISGFGPTGPYADKVAFDGIGQAMSGAVWLSGAPEQPVKSFASWVDFATAMLASQATLAALIERSRSGQGQEVQASLFASALTVMNFPLIEQALTGVDRQATGNRAQSGGPSDAVRTRDGWILVQVIGEPMFRRWARLMGEPHWLEDPRFSSDALRSANGEILSARTAAWAAELSTAQALEALARARLPAGPILSPRQVLEDSHVAASGMMTPMHYPGAEAAPLVIGAAQLRRTPGALTRRAPLLDEHTGEILAELGFSEGEIETFRMSGVVQGA